VFRNLTLDPTSSNFVRRVVDEGSRLVRVADVGNPLPQRNGTLSGDLSTFPVAGDFPIATPSLKATIGAEGPNAVVLARKPASLLEARALLESALRAAKPDSPAFAEATVQASDNRLLVRAGTTAAPTDRVVFAAMSAPLVPPATAEDAGTVAALKLDTGGNVEANVQEYPLGYAGSRTAALNTGVTGADGSAPGGAALIGDLNAKTGIHALEEVDVFNLLCIPRAANATGAGGDLTETEAQAVMSVAISYCERRRAFFLMDTPAGIDDPAEIREWLDDNATLRHRNAALYYPRLRIPDPLDNFRLRTVGASGTIAGLCARIDASRGVWKAPAGTEATLRNVVELDDLLSDQENGALNPRGINCLRSFPVYGNVCWGARTLDGADVQASEWKYIPVRRLALMLEESLFRGTQWVVFEPNDEPLWSQIRLNIGAFMQSLFRQGAFQGRSPREAYFVKCDGETTTQNDIDLGVVNIVVGFAPLKPAEFVILRIQQLAGQIET
jgi:phage tail sheath protein FI